MRRRKYFATSFVLMQRAYGSNRLANGGFHKTELEDSPFPERAFKETGQLGSGLVKEKLKSA
jgi:hypothetical protein